MASERGKARFEMKPEGTEGAWTKAYSLGNRSRQRAATAAGSIIQASAGTPRRCRKDANCCGAAPLATEAHCAVLSSRHAADRRGRVPTDGALDPADQGSPSRVRSGHETHCPGLPRLARPYRPMPCSPRGPGCSARCGESAGERTGGREDERARQEAQRTSGTRGRRGRLASAGKRSTAGAHGPAERHRYRYGRGALRVHVSRLSTPRCSPCCLQQPEQRLPARHVGATAAIARLTYMPPMWVLLHPFPFDVTQRWQNRMLPSIATCTFSWPR